MRASIQRISSATPALTQGRNRTEMYPAGPSNSTGSPFFMKKLPNTFVSTTTVAQTEVLTRRRTDSFDIVARRENPRSVPGTGGRRRGLGRLVFCYELSPLGA